MVTRLAALPLFTALTLALLAAGADVHAQSASSAIEKTTAAIASTADLVQNPSFEALAPAADGKAPLPAQWIEDGSAPVAKLVPEARTGKQAMFVEYKEGFNKNGYAGLIQGGNAAAIAGKAIKIEAHFRRTGENSKVGFWIAFSDADKKRVLYENTYAQPVALGAEWSKHTLNLTVPATAVRMMYGVSIHNSDGQMWVDDVLIVTTNK
jgi:hypothetical protein